MNIVCNYKFDRLLKLPSAAAGERGKKQEDRKEKRERSFHRSPVFYSIITHKPIVFNIKCFSSGNFYGIIKIIREKSPKDVTFRQV